MSLTVALSALFMLLVIVEAALRLSLLLLVWLGLAILRAAVL